MYCQERTTSLTPPHWIICGLGYCYMGGNYQQNGGGKSIQTVLALLALGSLRRKQGCACPVLHSLLPLWPPHSIGIGMQGRQSQGQQSILMALPKLSAPRMRWEPPWPGWQLGRLPLPKRTRRRGNILSPDTASLRSSSRGRVGSRGHALYHCLPLRGAGTP